MRVVLSCTRVSRLVTELADAGLVTRVAGPDDGRATLATITDDGRSALRTAAPVYLADIAEHVTRHLTERERRVIASGLQRVINAHDAALDPRR